MPGEKSEPVGPSDEERTEAQRRTGADSSPMPGNSRTPPQAEGDAERERGPDADESEGEGAGTGPA